MQSLYATSSATAKDGVVATVTAADPMAMRTAKLSATATDVLCAPLAQWAATTAHVDASADVQCLAFSPTSTHVAVAADNGSVTVWRLAPPAVGGAAPKPVFAMLGAHAKGATAVAWNAEGTRLASGGRDSFVAWVPVDPSATTASAEQPVRPLRFGRARDVHADTVYSVVWQPAADGVILSSDRGGAVAAWQCRPSAYSAATVNDDDTLSNDDAAPLWVLPAAHAGEMVRGLAVVPFPSATDAARPHFLASVGRDDAIRVWGLAAEGGASHVVGPVGLKESAHRMTVTCVAAWVAPGVVDAGKAEGGGQAAAATLRARLATGGGDDVVRVWSLTITLGANGDGGAAFDLSSELRGHADSVLAVAACPAPAAAATATAAPMEVVASASRDTTVFVWDATAGHPLRRLVASGTTPMAIAAVTFSHDGSVLAASGFDKILRLYDARRGTPLQRHGHKNTIRAVTASPDGARLVTAGRDKLLCVWSVDAAIAAAPDTARAGGKAEAVEAVAAPVASLTLPQPIARVAFPPACRAPGRHVLCMLAQDGALAWVALDGAPAEPVLSKPEKPGAAAFEAATAEACALCEAAPVASP